MSTTSSAASPDSRPDSRPASPGDAAPGAHALEADARALHRTLEDLIRLIQFRDRDRICCHDVSVSQCYALEALAQGGPQRLNDLAGRLYLDKSTASRVVDGLVTKGHARRRRHPDDGRAVLVEATAQGLEVYGTIEAELVEEVRALLADFDPEVRRAMTRLLGRLVEAAEERVEVDAGCCRLKEVG